MVRGINHCALALVALEFRDGLWSCHPGTLHAVFLDSGAFAACAILLRYFMVFLQVFYVVLFSLSCGVVVGLLFTLYIGCDIGVAPAGWWLGLWLPSSTAVAFACLRSLRGMPIPAPGLTFGVSGAALVAEGSLGPAWSDVLGFARALNGLDHLTRCFYCGFYIIVAVTSP